MYFRSTRDSSGDEPIIRFHSELRKEKKKKKKKKKKRLILDLRHVDQYLFKYKFRCKDVFSCKGVLNPGNFVFF